MPYRHRNDFAKIRFFLKSSAFLTKKLHEAASPPTSCFILRSEARANLRRRSHQPRMASLRGLKAGKKGVRKILFYNLDKSFLLYKIFFVFL